MNTEQLKTAEQILEDNGILLTTFYSSSVYDAVVRCMNSFASQESKKAVDEFKEKLKAEYKNKIEYTKKTIEQVPPAWAATRTALEAIRTEYEYLIDKL